MTTPQHRDFLSEVPAYRYDLVCGHHVFYREPVARGDHGYCRTCRTYWVHDETVMEYPPRNVRRRLADSEVADLIDKAIIRNRIADLLLATVGGESTYGCNVMNTIANTLGTSTKLVYQVARELGLAPLSTELESAAA